MKKPRRLVLERLVEKSLQNENPGFHDYQVNIVWNSEGQFDPTNEAVEIKIKTGLGEYSSNWATRKFLDKMFAKNKRTGECADGTYFAIPRMIVVKRIDELSIRATIEDMRKNYELDVYFSRVD